MQSSRQLWKMYLVNYFVIDIKMTKNYMMPLHSLVWANNVHRQPVGKYDQELHDASPQSGVSQ